MVSFEHQLRHFKPEDFKEGCFEEIALTVDELEAMRLSFLENLSQIEAADCMDVHQSTFQRTLKRALEKVTEAFVYGKSIKIEGGDYRMPGGDGSGPAGEGPGVGRSRGAEDDAGTEEMLAARKGRAYALNADTRCPTSRACPATRLSVKNAGLQWSGNDC